MKWQPIETAPKGDGSGFGPVILIYRPKRIGGGGRICVAAFDPESFRKNPRPHWHSFFGTLSKYQDRDNPPTHWMPLPEPPEDT